MADYYPLIARAVTGLDKNTGENRRALYERARTALVTQLRGVEPALGEADITRERLALEEAIRKVEAEAARRPRQETPEAPPLAAPPPRFEAPPAYVPPPPPPPPPPQPAARSVEMPEPPEDWKDLQRELDEMAPEPETEPRERERPSADRDEPPLPLEMEPRPQPPAALPRTIPWDEPVTPRPAARKLSGERGSLVDQGLKGFRDVVSETDDLGNASASASRSARERREAFTSMRPSSEMERIEPRISPAFTPDDLAHADADIPPPPRVEPRAEPRPVRKRVAPSRVDEDEFDSQGRHLRPGRGRAKRAVLGLLLIAIVVGTGFLAYQYRSNIAGLFQAARAPSGQQASKDASQGRPKISDRIGGAQQDGARSNPADAAVAQRAILYEQGATPQERKQYVGSVIWKKENTSAGPGQAADVAIKGEVEIPERHLRLDLTIRRNLDASVPASHTFEVKFTTPPDFQPGGIADMPGVVMESNQPGSGAPLRGLRVKVTNGYFLIGLLSGDADVQRNVQLMKDRSWLFLRVAYNNGQSALLTIEKGVPGDRVFEDVLNAWGQNPPQQRGG